MFSLVVCIVLVLFLFLLLVCFIFTCPRKKKTTRFNKSFKGKCEFKDEIVTLDIGESTHVDYRDEKRSIFEGNRIRVVTYNIEMGRRLNDIIEDLKRADGHIILLQEVESKTTNTAFHDSGKEVAAALKMNYYFVCEYVCKDKVGFQGNAILTCFDFEELDMIEYECVIKSSIKRHKLGRFPHPHVKHTSPRATIRIGEQLLDVISLHLDPHYCGKKGRVKQMSEIFKKFEPRQNAAQIITGDLNTVITGIGRFNYPKLSTERSDIFGGFLRSTEAQYFDRKVIKKSRFFDPFEKNSCLKIFPYCSVCSGKGATFVSFHGLFAAKLDWILLEKGRFSLSKTGIVSGASDHDLSFADVEILFE